MTFDKWVEKYNGKKIDYDGAYGVQCVDLIKSFIKNVLSITPQPIGNAIEYYNKRKTSKYITSNFDVYGYKKGMVFKKGDILVLKGKSAYGHVAVATGDYSTMGVYGYDENYKGTGAGMTLRFYDFGGFYKILCVLRPKNQAAIAPAPKTTQPVKPSSKYFPKYTGTSGSIVDALVSLKIDSSYAYRKKIAKANGIKAYIGSPSQNTKLLGWLKKGNLLRP